MLVPLETLRQFTSPMHLPLVDIPSPLGVVPVFVNAGAALLPAIFAGLASAVALLFKPRELLRVCQSKPYIPIIVVGAALGLYFFVGWMEAPAAAAQDSGRSKLTPAGASQTDWAKVALEILRQERNAAPGPAVPLSAEGAEPAPKDETAGSALVFRGNYSRSGYLGGPSPTGLALLWEYRQDNTMVLSSPLVTADHVFGATTYLDPPGSYGSVFCLDAATGEKIWETFLKSGNPDVEFKGFFSSPALTPDGKTLVIGQGLHADVDSELVGLDAATGRVRWIVPTPLHVEGSPAIEGDLVVAGAGAVEAGANHKPQGDPKGVGNPGYVFAVSISEGRELWRYQVNDPESSPAIHDGVVFIGSGMNGSAVVALKTAANVPETERLVWRAETPFPATGSVTLAGDVVLVGCGNGDFVFAAPSPAGLVIALDRKTGETKWTAPMPDAVLGTIAVKGDTAICPVRNGEIVAIDLSQKGRELWRSKISEKPALSGPAFTGTHVYATSSDGNLSVLDAGTGKVIERHYINAEGKPGDLGLSLSSPIVAQGRVYVGSETGGLRCYGGSGAQ